MAKEIEEEALRSDVEAVDLATKFEGSPDEQGEEETDALGTYETFTKNKHELAKLIGGALNETSLSLDFVSLLISSVKPNLGKSTISPLLSKNVPLGSLAADRIESTGPNNSKECAAIGQGWKLESLTKITDSLRTASIRLNEQVLRERNYWENVHTVLQNGEVLYKARDPTTGHRGIGVKYGYGDSGSNYHDKGLAILKRNIDGNVSLLPILNEVSSRGGTTTKVAEKVHKYIRVKILSKIDDDYMLTGQSVFNSKSILGGKDAIINDIEKARYFLFEEDLFHQLTREAKTLINYNVSIISNKIIIEVYEHIIEIEAVVYDENNEEELNNLYQNINRESSMNNSKAQHILIFLKLMLCCFYKYNLDLRRDVPTARAKWKLANSHPLILRPLLGHIRHEINFKNVQYVLGNLLADFDKDTYKIRAKKYLTLSPIGETKTIRDIFEKSTKSPKSELKVKLVHPTNGKVLKIDVTLSATESYCNLIVNLVVNRYNSLQTYKEDKDSLKLLEVKVTEIYDVEECLEWIISKFINKT